MFKIFGSKRGDVTGEWRKLHNEQLHDLYSSAIMRVINSRIMRWAVHVARIGEERLVQGIDGETWGRRPLGRSGRRWEDNIKIDLQEVGYGGAWTALSWVRIGTGVGHL